MRPQKVSDYGILGVTVVVIRTGFGLVMVMMDNHDAVLFQYEFSTSNDNWNFVQVMRSPVKIMPSDKRRLTRQGMSPVRGYDVY